MKSCRAEGGAKIFGVFRLKNHNFTQKNHNISNFRGSRDGCAPWHKCFNDFLTRSCNIIYYNWWHCILKEKSRWITKEQNIFSTYWLNIILKINDTILIKVISSYLSKGLWYLKYYFTQSGNKLRNYFLGRTYCYSNKLTERRFSKNDMKWNWK